MVRCIRRLPIRARGARRVPQVQTGEDYHRGHVTTALFLSILLRDQIDPGLFVFTHRLVYPERLRASRPTGKRIGICDARVAFIDTPTAPNGKQTVEKTQAAPHSGVPAGS